MTKIALKLQRMHRYYRLSGFYAFVGKSLKKAFFPIAAVIGLLIMLDLYVVDFNAVLVGITETYNPLGIYSVFFVSESLLGLVPPEIFIAWALKASNPLLFITLLGLVSYAGGIVSYFIGVWLLRIPRIYQFLEVRMVKHFKNLRRWGAVLIVTGALLPIPYSMTCIAAGAIDYSFRSLLLFGLFRIARFFIYAAALSSVF